MLVKRKITTNHPLFQEVDVPVKTFSMPNEVPSPVWIFRIVHEQNLPHILQYGMLTRNQVRGDSGYVFVGDAQLTDKRHEYPVPLTDCGNLGITYLFTSVLGPPCCIISLRVTGVFPDARRMK